MKPNFFKVIYESIKYGWTDHEWGCSANWKWYIKKCFGSKFYSFGLEKSYLKRHNIHRMMGWVNSTEPESLWCLDCDLRYQKNEIYPNISYTKMTNYQVKQIIDTPIDKRQGSGVKYTKFK